MEWSREYLQRHNIHRLLEDCLEDLVVEQPSTKEGIVKAIVQRLETTRRRYDNPQQKVVLVLADPASTNVLDAVTAAADACGAAIVDGKGLRSEDVRDLLTTCADKAFIVNFPTCIGDAIAFEGCFGKPHKAVFFQRETFIKNVPRTDEKFIAYAKGVNAVGELYQAKGQLILAKDSNTEEGAAHLIGAFS